MSSVPRSQQILFLILASGLVFAFMKLVFLQDKVKTLEKDMAKYLPIEDYFETLNNLIDERIHKGKQAVVL